MRADRDARQLDELNELSVLAPPAENFGDGISEAKQVTSQTTLATPTSFSVVLRVINVLPRQDRWRTLKRTRHCVSVGWGKSKSMRSCDILTNRTSAIMMRWTQRLQGHDGGPCMLIETEHQRNLDYIHAATSSFYIHHVWIDHAQQHGPLKHI